MEVSLTCHNTPRQNGWRSASDVTHRKRAEVCGDLNKVEELKLDTGRRRSTFGARRREANLRPMRGRSSWGPNEYDSIEDCVSPPYVETFNSKVIKRFRTWTRSRYVFSNSGIPMFFIYSIVMNIRCPFHPFRTWPYPCIWLCNKTNKVKQCLVCSVIWWVTT